MSLFLENCACGDIREKRVRKRLKVRNLEENRLYLLNYWFLWQGSAGHFCRTGQRSLDRISVMSLALMGI